MTNSKTQTKFPCTTVLRAATRRDKLLRTRRTLPALAVLGAVAALQGCIAVGGTARKEQPTTGRQLIDLKAALDAGAITEDEFKAAKARVLAQPA
jgi:hypothetical protein